jgi:hypothetical protein
MDHELRADIERREPRCRICRDEGVRRLVNRLLDWRGAPVADSQGKRHRVSYADILRAVGPLNEGRDGKDRITYDSLWVHAKRHYELAGIAAYWRTRMGKELRKALSRNAGPTYRRATKGPREVRKGPAMRSPQRQPTGTPRW